MITINNIDEKIEAMKKIRKAAIAEQKKQERDKDKAYVELAKNALRLMSANVNHWARYKAEPEILPNVYRQRYQGDEFSVFVDHHGVKPLELIYAINGDHIAVLLDYGSVSTWTLIGVYENQVTFKDLPNILIPLIDKITIYSK